MRITADTVRIAARKSDLARLQAYMVADALIAQFPKLKIEFQFRESLGDKNLNDPLWKMPEKGVFTEDFYQDLLQGRTDMVVHSWKDLPNELKPDTAIVATLPRADVRDLLLFKKSSLAKLKEKKALRIFSSSPRRSYNLIPFLSEHLPYGEQELGFEPVRGNIQTRVRKMLEAPEVDGLIVAKAAIDRLLTATRPEFSETREFLQQALTGCRWMVLPLTYNPAAAAQGALAVEILNSRADLKELLSAVNDRETFENVLSERKRLAQYGGGCHQKIGVTHLQRPFGKLEFLRGLTDQGEVLNVRKNLDREERSAVTVVGSDSQFERESLSFQVPTGTNAYFVSHPEAWSEQLPEVDILWTAGLRTWKALATKGLWVNGSSESLGEQENPRIEALAPTVNWAKLGHEQGTKSPGKAFVATYRLVAKKQNETGLNSKLSGSRFYWKSASVFRSALEKQPELIEKQHYCGPGNSYDEIRKFHPQIQVLWPAPQDV